MVVLPGVVSAWIPRAVHVMSASVAGGVSRRVRVECARLAWRCAASTARRLGATFRCVSALYGYKHGQTSAMEADRAEQATVARARQLRDQGCTLGGTGRALASENRFNRRGKRFSASSIRQLLGEPPGEPLFERVAETIPVPQLVAPPSELLQLWPGLTPGQYSWLQREAHERGTTSQQIAEAIERRVADVNAYRDWPA